jgi:hypothetical protein
MEENIERAAPPTEELNVVDAQIQALREQVRDITKRIDWLVQQRELMLKLPKGNFCGSLLDFDNLPREDVVKVIRAMGGKWDKEPGSGNTITYVRKEPFKDVRVRIWQGQPPPSCKIVEVDEHVPEVVIAAHTRKVRKMVCHPEPGAYIAQAAENHPDPAGELPSTTPPV